MCDQLLKNPKLTARKTSLNSTSQNTFRLRNKLNFWSYHYTNLQ
jgi:hypothetical protein